jgi:tetratricopeptide (TPR) repeat protein
MQAILRRFEASIYVQDAREGDVEGAIAGVRVLVDEAPEDTDLWGSLIQLLFAQRRHDEARDLLAAALDEDPERLQLYGLLAAVESAQGDDEAAEATFRRLIERQPSATAYAALSGLLAKKDDPDAALAVLDEGLAAVEGADALHIVRAETLLEAGRVDDAAEVVASLDAYDVDPKQRLLLRARIALDRGDAESARDQLEALVPELDNAATQFWLGQALEATGDLAGAERRYGVALNRSTRDPAGAFAAYQLAAARGDWQTAAAYGQMMMTRAPGRDDAWRALLVALVELGDGPRAEKIATAGVQHFPEDDRLRALHAASLRIQGRHEEALAALGPPAEDEPTPVASERGMALAASGDLASARETLGAAIERAPEAPELQHALATVLYQAGGAEEGDAAVDRALALDPDDLRPLRRRLEFRAATGRLDGARADAERYLALRPQDAGVHYVAGVVNEGLGRSDDAIAAYRRAAELDATAVAPRNNLAVLLGHSGKLEEALEAAQQAYRLEPGSPYVLDTLGWLYLKSERVERAISLLEEATALEPPLPDAQLHLALAYRDAGRTEEARELLVALGPTAPEPLRAEVEKALATLR